MAKIVPIRGIRYSNQAVADLYSVVTPPYDIIDEASQELYYERHPYNVIRLELGKTFDGDNEQENRYTRAAKEFAAWLARGVLMQEAAPALYLYEQEFSYQRRRLVRSGFMCGVMLEEYSNGQVLPHEETLPKAKADRFELLKATEANFSPIMGLYVDRGYSLSGLFTESKKNLPDIDFIDETGQAHRVWVVTDPNLIKKVQEAMIDRKIYIADGHHRYETALQFYREKRVLGLEGYDHVLMALFSISDPGLVILPTHRLVRNVQPFDSTDLLKSLSEDFLVEQVDLTTLGRGAGASPGQEEFIGQFLAEKAQEVNRKHVIGMYLGKGDFYALTLERESALDEVAGDKTEAWKHLDVSVLHLLVLEKRLHISSQQRESEQFLTYTRDEFFALQAVDDGLYQVAFFLNPTRVDQLTAVAASGEKMPQKSTYFYPKLITGLVINWLGSGRLDPTTAFASERV